MKKTSETRPETLSEGQYGTYEFCWNIRETEDGYSYDSVDVVGELIKTNIKHAMMLERYDEDELTMFENAKHDNPGTNDLGVIAYFAVKAWVEDIIENSGIDIPE